MVDDVASNFDRDFGRRLRFAREIRGLTRDGLGILLGISANQIGKYETGESTFPAARFIKTASHLKCTAAFLLGESKPEIGSTNAEIAARPDVAALVRILLQRTDVDVKTVMSLLAVIRADIDHPIE